ncbi:hypothetical protein [Sphingomonas sp.]|uniref:hypothetical protein n=1 Tax=Sphingomonas sp. TaxID=28214 RepID=UPI0031D234CA
MARGCRSILKVQPAPRGKRWQARWGKAMRAAFLDHLAATCNVSRAAAAAGVFPATVYAARRRDPEFAAQWEEALALGYQMLETRLVGHVLEGRRRDEQVEGGDPGDSGGIDFEAALRLLSQHRTAQGKPHKGRQPQFAAPEETDKMLLKRLAHIEARRAREAGWAAAVAAGKAVRPGGASERGADDGE